MTITSRQNQKLKEIRKLGQRRRARDGAQRFVAEGEDLLAAADAAGWTAIERYCAEGSGLEGTPVSPQLLAGASELGSGTRALAVYDERWRERPQGPLVVYLHGVGDPGNVGAILRCAEAFGASAVALGPDTADPYGPKAVRASMGAIFTVPVCRTASEQLPGTTIALAIDAPETLDQLTPAGEISLLIGAERTGLPRGVLDAADHVARIPIANHSLNAAMAAAVALYELRRMRR